MLSFVLNNYRYEAVQQGYSCPASVGQRYLRFNVGAIVAHQTGFSSFTPQHFEALRQNVAQARYDEKIAQARKAFDMPNASKPVQQHAKHLQSF